MAFFAVSPSIPFTPLPSPKSSPYPPKPSLKPCNPLSRRPKPLCNISDGGVGLTGEVFGGEALRRVAGAKDADEALELVGEAAGGLGGLGLSELHSVIEAAFDRGNADLALSVFYAACSASRRSAFEGGGGLDGWSWAKPDVRTYGLMIRRLAACLRVSDAITMISYVSRMGVSLAEEVPFGNIVKCPSCMIAVAVAQPQQGIQVVSCHQCRYQYELVSGDILNIESEEVNIHIFLRKYSCRTQR